MVIEPGCHEIERGCIGGPHFAGKDLGCVYCVDYLCRLAAQRVVGRGQVRVTLTGSGSSTNPQDVHWYCHACGWAGMLKAGEHHACQPQITHRRALRALSRTRLPGLWRLSGWARRGLDADALCPRCYARWSEGIWFWRWCRKCP